MSDDMKVELINYLRGLADGSIEPICLTTGVCYSMYREFPDVDICMPTHEEYKDFPYYSGNEVYPIGYRGNGSSEFYHYIGLGMNMWDSSDGYGRRRLEFCNWLADYYEKQLYSKRRLSFYKWLVSFLGNGHE